MTDALRVLVPVDDSASSLRAAEHVVKLHDQGLATDVHLLNVQAPLRGTAATLIAQSELDNYHREEGMKVLARAHGLFEQAGMPVHDHVVVGDPGASIVTFAGRLGCRLIVMGTRGLGGFAGLIMGSVANHVVAESDIPVTLVRA